MSFGHANLRQTRIFGAISPNIRGKKATETLEMKRRQMNQACVCKVEPISLRSRFSIRGCVWTTGLKQVVDGRRHVAYSRQRRYRVIVHVSCVAEPRLCSRCCIRFGPRFVPCVLNGSYSLSAAVGEGQKEYHTGSPRFRKSANNTPLICCASQALGKLSMLVCL